jgi:hypothetical protein
VVVLAASPTLVATGGTLEGADAATTLPRADPTGRATDGTSSGELGHGGAGQGVPLFGLSMRLVKVEG